MNPFAYLKAWARVRRIVGGRHGGPRVIYYTSWEAIEQDFGPRGDAYMLARKAFDP